MTTLSSRILVLPLQEIFHLPSHIQIVVDVARTTGNVLRCTLDQVQRVGFYLPRSLPALPEKLSRRTRPKNSGASLHLSGPVRTSATRTYDCLGAEPPCECVARTEHFWGLTPDAHLQETPLRAKNLQCCRAPSSPPYFHRPVMHQNLKKYNQRNSKRRA